MYKGFKIRLYPTKEQEAQLWKTIHAVRWTWNWALEYQMKLYENNEKLLTAYNLKKVFTTERNDKKNVWLKEVSRNSCALVIFDLANAYKRFFDTQKCGAKFTKSTIEQAKRKGRELTFYDMNGHPKFKSKHKAKHCIPTPADVMYFINGKVKLSKIGRISYVTNYNLPQGRNECKFYNPRVVYENGKWILAFAMKCESNTPKLNDYCAGIDLGIKNLATISCDEQMQIIPNINKTKSVNCLWKRLRRQQRKAARRVNGSRNQNKMYKKIRKTYARIKNIRKNHNHHATHKIVSLLPKAIGIENLNVSGMMKNRCLSKAIQDCNFREIRKQLEYKSERYGIKITVADKFFPSSKRCSKCGNIHKKLTLQNRVYSCEKCGLKIDRDFNAALNLEKLATRSI